MGEPSTQAGTRGAQGAAGGGGGGDLRGAGLHPGGPGRGWPRWPACPRRCCTTISPTGARALPRGDGAPGRRVVETVQPRCGRRRPPSAASRRWSPTLIGYFDERPDAYRLLILEPWGSGDPGVAQAIAPCARLAGELNGLLASAGQPLPVTMAGRCRRARRLFHVCELRMAGQLGRERRGRPGFPAGRSRSARAGLISRRVGGPGDQPKATQPRSGACRAARSARRRARRAGCGRACPGRGSTGPSKRPGGVGEQLHRGRPEPPSA